MAYSLEDINFRTVTDPKGFVEESDDIYRKKVEKSADLITENIKNSPIVLLSGPSGSGKTTTAMKISEELNRRGVGTHYVGMDDYFKTVGADTPRLPLAGIMAADTLHLRLPTTRTSTTTIRAAPLRAV